MVNGLTDYTNARAEQVGRKLEVAAPHPCLGRGNNKYKIPTPDFKISTLAKESSAPALPGPLNNTMPLPGKGHSLSARDEYPFFTSLAQLDSWSETASLATHRVIPHLPRRQTATRGRLLV